MWPEMLPQTNKLQGISDTETRMQSLDKLILTNVVIPQAKLNIIGFFLHNSDALHFIKLGHLTLAAG